MRTIPLTQHKVAVVDDADFEWLSRHKWCAKKDKRTWYAVRGVQKDGKITMVYMHREILKPPANMETDHKDGNGLSNQRCNLRAATHAENGHNRRKRKGISQFKGVRWRRDRAKWRAQITVEGKQVHLGYFLSEIEAARAYDAAARKYFGEFARTNFGNIQT